MLMIGMVFGWSRIVMGLVVNGNDSVLIIKEKF